jgi:hypothetical protein
MVDADGTKSKIPLVLIAIVVVALAVGAGLLAVPKSEAPLQGRSLAQEILNQALVPPGSIATDSVNPNLKGPPSVVGCSPLWDLHKMLLVGSSTDVWAFVQSHLPKDDRITGSGISGGPGVPTVSFFTVTVASTEGSRAPMVLYSFVPAGRSSTALRVDAQVMLPTSRCVAHGSEVEVPNVVSKPMGVAMHAVVLSGFVPRRVPTELCVGPVSYRYPHLHTVAEQRPGAHTYAKRGSTITLLEPTRSNPTCA